MDKNNPNKKPKPNQRVAESNVEHEHLLQEGIDNGMTIDDNVVTININTKQSNSSKVEIHNSREREVCACTK